MVRGKKSVERVTELMKDPKHIRNIGIVAHIDHGKTTLSDNLLAGAGIISEELAGKQLFMDSDPEEQARGITIDAVEGTMPQTETVLRQALKEGVRPILFINKVDRLVNELKVDEMEMQIRLGKVIDKVNKLIKGMNEESYNNGWKLDASLGTVAFGSALYNWAVSVPFMKKSGISFKIVYEKCRAGDMKYLAKNSPLSDVLLDIVVHQLPNPLDAQKRRIPIIWH